MGRRRRGRWRAAGLAVSIELGRAGLGHIVRDRGRVGERWRSPHWDSFRLNPLVWVNRVPANCKRGPPQRFPTAPELVAGLVPGYAEEVPGGIAQLHVRPPRRRARRRRRAAGRRHSGRVGL